MTVFRSKIEKREGRKEEQSRIEIYEKIYHEAAEEIEKEYEATMKTYKSKKKLSDIDDGEELWNFMKHSSDGIPFEVWIHFFLSRVFFIQISMNYNYFYTKQMDLTAAQKKLLTDYQTKLYENKQNKIAAIVEKKLNVSAQPPKSTALQKVRLIDATAPNAQKTAILSIWNANAQISLRENTLFDLRFVTANGMRGKDVLLTASNRSIFREVKPFASTVYGAFTRSLTAIADIDSPKFKPHCNEFDTMGVVVKVDCVASDHYQSVFVADAQQNLLCVKFWGGLQQYAYEDVVKEQKIIVMSQLEWRSYKRLNLNGVVQAFATQITTFSENSKSSERLYALNCLRKQFDDIDLTAFTGKCVKKLQQNKHRNLNPIEIHANWLNDENFVDELFDEF